MLNQFPDTMHYFRPNSFVTLILSGFLLVSLPLILAVINASIGVGQFADESRRTVYRAVQATQNGRILSQLIVTLERTARQFEVLGDEALFLRYQDGRRDFYHIIQKLSTLDLNAQQRKTLNRLAEHEQLVFDALQERHRKEDDPGEVATGFGDLRILAQSLLRSSYRHIDVEMSALEENAESSRRMLFWQALAIIPLTVLVAGLFTVLISRPMSQINVAIRNLGDGRFTQPIHVAGPTDIESISERLNWLRKRLLEVDEEKNRFLRNVSHELKTPLTSIREGTELLAEQIAGPLEVKQLEIVRILRDSSRRLQRMIENLLTYNAARASNPSPLAQRIALHELVEAVLKDHHLTMLARELAVNTQLERVHVLGQAEQLKIVIDNLVSNAIKHSPPKGRIDIRLHRSHGKVHLEVSDSGQGIPRKERDRIFDPFYQGTMQPGGHISGSGLGLSIARECVLAHNGSIELEQRGTPGAHFHVVLPDAGGRTRT